MLSTSNSLATLSAAPRQPETHTARLDAQFASAERLAALDPTARATYRRLAVLRVRLAKEAGVKAYHVFTNRHLLELAERRPTDREGLGKVSGFGQLRLVSYGDEILAAIRPI